MSENIFQETPETAVEPKPSFSIPTEVEGFVGEGKKYRSVEDALKSVPHAQEHISKLEQELATLREQVTKSKTAQELLDEIRRESASVNQPVADKGFDVDAVAPLVDQIISQREAQVRQKENASKVVSEFTKVFGEKAEEQFIKLAADSGLSVQELNRLSATSPNAVLKLAGLTQSKENVQRHSGGDVNTERFQNNSNEPISARVGRDKSSTKDVVNAWRRAGEKVKQNLS